MTSVLHHLDYKTPCSPRTNTSPDQSCSALPLIIPQVSFSQISDLKRTCQVGKAFVRQAHTAANSGSRVAAYSFSQSETGLSSYCCKLGCVAEQKVFKYRIVGVQRHARHRQVSLTLFSFARPASTFSLPEPPLIAHGLSAPGQGFMPTTLGDYWRGITIVAFGVLCCYLCLLFSAAMLSSIRVCRCI